MRYSHPTSMPWFVAAAFGLAPFFILGAADHLRLGAEAPHLQEIRRSLRSGSASAVGSRMALVFGIFPDSAPCSKELAKLTLLRREMTNLRTAVVAVTSQSEEEIRQVCPDATRALNIVYDRTQQVARAFGAEQKQTGVLIDENGITRRVVRVAGDLHRELTDDVRLWNDGMAVYEANCARCHGADGRDTTYPEIKSLAGIGNRMGESEILRRTSLTGAVDMSGWTEQQSRALAAYVAGL